MKIVFFVGILWLGYVYAGYPLLLGLLSLVRRARPALSDDHLPLVSVLISARNEEKDIGWKIAETLAWDYPPERLEILVASDASQDSTYEIVCGFADPRVTCIRLERRGGKARALNRLAEMARGEIFFFTDANAHVGPRALRVMVRHFADPRVGCVTGDSQPIDEIDHPAVTRGAGVYWGYESIVKHLENRVGSVLVCDGAIFCMRSALYRPLCPELANDVELPMQAGAAGYWVTHEPQALASERETSSPLEEFKRRRRMCAQGVLAMSKLASTLRGLRGWQFVSHKFLRWLSLIPMLMLLGSSALLARHSAGFALALLVQGIFYGTASIGLANAIAGRPTGRLIAVPFYVVLGVVAAAVGVIESLLGKRFDVWEIPALSRGLADKSLGEAKAARENVRYRCILTIDVEDWFHILELPSAPRLPEWELLPSRVERNFLRLLDLVDEQRVSCTCFFVGWIAQRFPGLVKAAVARGHEIASHGWAHRPAHELTPDEFFEDCFRAKNVIEQISGRAVLGYRSAGFSLSGANQWVFDQLLRAGYLYDASVFPAPRAHGGWQNGHDSPYRVCRPSGTLLEFPMTVEKVFGQPVCFFGGGYLRLFPLWLIERMATRVLRHGRPVIFYVHPREIDLAHPRLPMNPWRHFKSYVNLGTTESKLRRLLATYRFVKLEDLVRDMNSMSSEHCIGEMHRHAD